MRGTTSEFARRFAVERLPPEGLTFTIEASPGERQSLASRLELERLDALRATGRISRGGAGDLVRVEADVTADLAQSCVVTLEPVPARPSFRFERLFTLAPTEPDDEIVLDPAALDLEPLEGAELDIGELVVEELALHLDPYPRAPGADEELAVLLPPEVPEGPLAELAALRKGTRH
jgi:uncharacterized metal-binding protein YceD (DUF177 family)